MKSFQTAFQKITADNVRGPRDNTSRVSNQRLFCPCFAVVFRVGGLRAQHDATT
jgi:hypothetical protein